MHITLLYSGLLGLLLIWLSARTIMTRRRLKISRGDGGNPEMARARGVHSNTAQYVPFALLMMGFCEASGVAGIYIHALGLVLLISRIIYIYGAGVESQTMQFRVMGMVGTFLALGGASILSIAIGLVQMMD